MQINHILIYLAHNHYLVRQDIINIFKLIAIIIYNKKILQLLYSSISFR